jgi:hypothetical protein
MVNTYIAHHFSNIPLYGLVIVFLASASYTIALINWTTDLYRKKSLKYKLVISGLNLVKYVYYNELQRRAIRFGVGLLNNSDIPIFHKIELVNYYLANTTNSNINDYSDKEPDLISSKCTSHRSFPVIDIPFENKGRTGELTFKIAYGKSIDNLNYKINVQIKIVFMVLENNQIDYSYNIKKFEYI